MKMLRCFLEGLADMIFPKICLVCKNKIDASSVYGLICHQCWGKIKKNLPPFCHSCGRHLDTPDSEKKRCPRCLKTMLHFDRAFSPCVYTGVIKELIHMFKYNKKECLGTVLSKLMIEFIKEYGISIDYLDLIVPIPLAKTRLREREFNQSKILAALISQEFNKKILCDNLIRTRHTKTQTELDLDKRLSNIKGGFLLKQKEDIKGKKILLVDDVLTSGATCSEAAYVLKEAGALTVFVLTIAN